MSEEFPAEEWHTDYVAVFIGRMFRHATDEEVRDGMTIEAFEHEGVSMPERFITGWSGTHRMIAVEPGHDARIFSSREEAEAFIETITVRRSGWSVIPRVSKRR